MDRDHAQGKGLLFMCAPMGPHVESNPGTPITRPRHIAPYIDPPLWPWLEENDGAKHGISDHIVVEGEATFG